jgi:hypothetical protein
MVPRRHASRYGDFIENSAFPNELMCASTPCAIQSTEQTMSLYYTHLLTPEGTDFAPQSQQVVAFLDDLSRLGGTPLEPTFKLGNRPGILAGRNFVTGETISIPTRPLIALSGIAEVGTELAGLNDYDLVMEGQGPPTLPPFRLYEATAEEKEFMGRYAYWIRCCLRKEPVSTSYSAPFGKLCRARSRTGIFHHPTTGAIIETPDAACASFWIEFHFGKFLLPRIGNHLTLIEPSILKKASQYFGQPFAQGCLWG